MKTKTRDLSTCLKRRLWIVGVCLTTFSFLSVSVAYAVSDNQTVQQQKKGMVIKGKVLGTDGEPIIGASVLVKGSTTGVVTDLDGNYTLSNYNPQIQISAESETKRSIFREKDKTKRSKKESAQHSKSRNKSFVMTSVSAL